MILTDRDIKEISNCIVPFHKGNVEPCSYDFTLDDAILIQRPGQKLKIGDEIKSYKIAVEDYALKPNDFVLASTREKVFIPDNIAAEVAGKSTIGRYGLEIHQTAGWIDAGFEGNITLEIVNNSENEIQLVEGMKIAQLIFHKLTGNVENPYNGKYQHSDGVVDARAEKVDTSLAFEPEEEMIDESQGYEREILDGACESGICPSR